MVKASSNRVTALLEAHGAGDPTALDQLLPLVYEEMRALASRAFRSAGAAHTLQPTAVVHEAWMKLAGGLSRVNDRAHFLAVASRAMRQVLTDHARGVRAAKRGERCKGITLSEALDGQDSATVDLVTLDDSLDRLGRLRPRHARVVELRFFGGLTIAEAAKALDVCPATVESDWAMARAWLRRELRAG